MRKTHTLNLFRPSVIAAMLLSLTLTIPAHADTELLNNGAFETGDFTGWMLANQNNPSDVGSSDHFSLSQPGADTPAINGISFPTASNPMGGTFYAVSVSDSPGAHALLHNFTVPLNATSVALSFQMFVNDQSGVGPAVDPSGLDYLTGGISDPFTGGPLDNQHARVDLLTAGSGDLSTDIDNIIRNFYQGVDNAGGGTPNLFQNYAFDLTPFVTPGQSYRLRFAEVDNLSALNVGVDNVSIIVNGPSNPPAVPEPGPVAVGMALLGGITWIRGIRRRKRRNPITKHPALEARR